MDLHSGKSENCWLIISFVVRAFQLGKWLPIISRVVVRTILGAEPDERGEDPAHWNVVQNNGQSFSAHLTWAYAHINLNRSPSRANSSARAFPYYPQAAARETNCVQDELGNVWSRPAR